MRAYFLNISKAWSISFGKGAFNFTGEPERGWLKETRAEWRACLRIRPMCLFLNSGREYRVSPTSGCPAAWQWTLIWWVLPVMSLNFKRAQSANCSITSYQVTDGAPSGEACRSMMLPGSLSMGRSMIPLAEVKVPWTMPRYSFWYELSCIWRMSSFWTYGFSANTITPEVSLSSLLTGRIRVLTPFDRR